MAASNAASAPSADDLEARVAAVVRRARRSGASDAQLRLSAESYVKCLRFQYDDLPTINLERAISKGCAALHRQAPTARRQQTLLPMAS